MRVGLNATCLNNRPSGARQRFVGIYRELVALSPEIDFVVFEPCDCDVLAWFNGAPNVSARKTPIPSEGRLRRLVKGAGYWRAALAAERLDVFESFHLPIHPAPSALNILTIHDLRGLTGDAGMLERQVFGAVLRRALAAADRVVTVSDVMAQALRDFDPGVEVAVVHNGLESAALEPVSGQALEGFAARFGLSPGFVLAVGHMEPRKNYPRLVEAMAQIHAAGDGRHLVIIGNDSGGRPALQDLIGRLGLAGQVHLLSGLTDGEVRCAYASCGLFVFPSTYEGFGIPILEAMAAAKPMVLSDLPVFREITQGSGAYFQPTSVHDMAKAILAMLSDNAEQRRVVEYGARRLEDFSYRQLARQVKALYRT